MIVSQDDRPPLLQPGSRVAVIAPSSPVEPERLAAGLTVLRDWGLRPELGQHVLARTRHTAGSTAERLADLRWAISEPGFDAIWMARGGTGAAHLLPGLAATPEATRPPRPVIGFSDATALFAAIIAAGRRDLTGVHGPPVTSLGDRSDARTRRLTHDLLFTGRGLTATLPGSGGDVVTAPLVGGNLTVLANLAGTPYALSGAGRMLLLEDAGEPPRRIDRALTQLAQAGCLDGVEAVILGDFADDHDQDRPDWADFTADWLRAQDLQVLTGIPVGHTPLNLPFVIGAATTLRPHGDPQSA